MEIERKFLVTSTKFLEASTSKRRIVQGFLNTHPERTVRVRLHGKNAFITVKGIGNSAGTTRFEWEKEIPVIEAEKLLELCEPGIIDKTRYEAKIGNHVFEVDVFHGENEGLTLAEVELAHEDDPFLKPDWLGKEVTGQAQYYNSQLSKNPFKTWKQINNTL